MKEQDNPPEAEFARSLEQLKAASGRLKDKIEQERKRHDLPLDSNLGDPNWEESAADGHLDVPSNDDED